MSIDSTIGANNIYYRGQSASGLYNNCYTTVAGIGWGQNYSQCKFLRRTVQPKVFSTTTGTTNYSIESYVRSKAVKFYFNLTLGTSGASDGVRYDSPFATSYDTDQSCINAATFSADATYQSCTSATANYGYAWSNWRKNGNFGTICSYSQNFLFYYNDSNQSGCTTLYATYVISGKSDRRLKENIRLIGRSVGGFNIYTWTYKNQERDGFGTYQGVMAQEVPHAAIEHPDGYLMVDYSKVDVPFKRVYGNNMGFREC